MMRHAYLDKDSYDYWYEESSQGVWPWFERLGARVLGDFQIVYPETPSETPEQDEALRFVRYASYEHWQATRPDDVSGETGGSLQLAGNGGLSDASSDGLSDRGQVLQGTKGGFFLQGYMAETRPIYMPGLVERFELVGGGQNADQDSPYPVRLASAEPRDEIIILQYRKIKKNSFEEFHAIMRDDAYPYLEKIEVRPVGEWEVAYLPNSSGVESEEYDEVYSLARFSSYEHYQTVRDNAVSLGGNGPDFHLMANGLQRLDAMTYESSVQFLKGPLWSSPPHYAPSLNENYRLID